MQIRILLDTGTIRAYIHRDQRAERLPDLRRHSPQVSVGLASNAVPELVVALHQGRIPWPQWVERSPALLSLVDPASPIFPDGNEMGAVFPELPPGHRGPISRSRHAQFIWTILSKARSVADLERGPSFTGSDGSEHRIGSSREVVERLVEDRREQWRRMIQSLQAEIVDYSPSQEHIAELQFKKLFGGSPDEGKLRLRHDGYVRSLARFVAMALQDQKRYSPRHNRRRGDSFDVELLTGLALPAIVCTLDERLRAHVRESGSVQASQILSPEELLACLNAGTIEQQIPESLRR